MKKTGSVNSGEKVAETKNAPSWLDGSWGYIDSEQAYKITIIDGKTLRWETVYYTENNGFEMEGSKTGVDYSVEREYVYDQADESVIISAYDATGTTTAVYGGDVGYLVKVRVTLAPNKDRDGRKAAMFTLYSEDESSDYEYSKLRYQRTDG